MLLKQMHLHNIRSYIDQRIEFPESTLMLSGDIGSGKSSILLALEFCLFGFRPKVLDGAALLRNGAKEGFAELSFTLDKNEISIRRTIRRTSRGIQQSSGYLIINGIKKDLTPVELKAQVLSLLGYPLDMLNRSKDQIFRYTVYTPQEDMKKIIMDEPEERLEVLRKVFNIDRYSRIRQAVLIYVKKLKEKSKKLEGMAEGIEHIKEQIAKTSAEKDSLQNERKATEPGHKELLERLKTAREDIEKTEESLKELTAYRNQLKLKDNDLTHILRTREKDSAEIERISKQIEELEPKIRGKDILDLRKHEDAIREKEEDIRANENSESKIKSNVAVFNSKLEESSRLISKISSLNNCPTCMQEVSVTHKSAISDKETEKTDRIRDELKRLSESIAPTKDSTEKLKAQLKEAQSILNEQKLFMMQKKEFDSLKERLSSLKEIQSLQKKDIAKINGDKMELTRLITSFAGIEESYKEKKKMLESISDKERSFALRLNSIERQIESVQKMSALLSEQMGKKVLARARFRKTMQMIDWFESFFIRLMSSMETHVFNSIASEFDSIFRQWMAMLLDEEQLQVRLDNEFTPVIMQNGYETEMRNLSGGEKTSVALAYRLALNRVINDLISTIKTSDLIILDEPTDGFSDYQLDKVREVLDELNIRQIIIVSHETKIESFADSTIRIVKDEHISKALV